MDNSGRQSENLGCKLQSMRREVSFRHPHSRLLGAERFFYFMPMLAASVGAHGIYETNRMRVTPMSERIPIVELRIRDLGSEIAAAVVLRREEIRQAITRGVENVVDGAANAIVEQATAEATKQIGKAVEDYFRWGLGRAAIETAVKTALAPITEALNSGSPR